MRSIPYVRSSKNFTAANASTCIVPIRASTLTESELAAAADLVARLAAALAPLESMAGQSHPLSYFADRHRDVLAALSRQGSDEFAFAGPDGGKLAEALDELATSAAAADLLVDASDYVELFSAAIADRVVRPPPRPDMRVRIFGTARSAPDRQRPRRARRPGRGDMAAGKPDRCLAQPPDAA